MGAAWWFTTLLGGVAAILSPIVANCTLGPDICPIITSVSGVISLLLGVTHPGFHVGNKTVIPTPTTPPTNKPTTRI